MISKPPFELYSKAYVLLSRWRLDSMPTVLTWAGLQPWLAPYFPFPSPHTHPVWPALPTLPVAAALGKQNSLQGAPAHKRASPACRHPLHLGTLGGGVVPQGFKLCEGDSGIQSVKKPETGE